MLLSHTMQQIAFVSGNQHFSLRIFLKSFSQSLTLYHTMTTFDKLEKKPFENIAGKEENAGNQHFLLFPHCFLLWEKKKMLVISIFFFSHIVFYPLKDNFNILSNI